MAMLVVTGKRTTATIDSAALDALLAGHRTLLVDLGCGDGAFPYRLAGAAPDVFCVGLDPNREAMGDRARRARAKPARGGRPNLLYVVAALESLPTELRGRAGLITIHFPWSGLLRALVEADPLIAEALSHLAAPDCVLQAMLNADAEVVGLPTITPATVGERLAPVLEQAGFQLDVCDWLPPEGRVRSRWGGRLIRGSRRRTVRLRAVRGQPDPASIELLKGALSG